MERNHVIIRFLPILFNQLFKVLIQNDLDDVTNNTTKYGGTAIRLKTLKHTLYGQTLVDTYP